MSPAPRVFSKATVVHGGKAVTSSSLRAQLLQLPVLLHFPSVPSFIPQTVMLGDSRAENVPRVLPQARGALSSTHLSL